MADQHFAIGYQLAHAFPNGPWIRPPVADGGPGAAAGDARLPAA
jgi:hypothetical protein